MDNQWTAAPPTQGGVDVADLRREVSRLRELLASQTLIADAVGLIMGCGRLTRQDAIAALERASQRNHLPVAEIARRIIDRHEQSV